MFNKKDEKIKAEMYAKTIIKELKVWKERYNIDQDSDIKMEDEDFEKLSNKLIPVLIKIIKNGNDFILTEDYLYYLSYLSLRLRDYGPEYIKLLEKLININEKDLAKLYRRYFGDILYNSYLKDVDGVNSYIDRMEGDYKNAFLEFQKNEDKLHNIFIRGYEHDAMIYLSSLIFAHCIKNNHLDLYSNFTSKYFDDPRQTIDFLSMNGFINKHLDLVKDFDNFIYDDMKQDMNSNIIR